MATTLLNPLPPNDYGHHIVQYSENWRTWHCPERVNYSTFL